MSCLICLPPVLNQRPHALLKLQGESGSCPVCFQMELQYVERRGRMCFLLGNPHSCWADDVITPTAHLCGGVSTYWETNCAHARLHSTQFHYQNQSKIGEHSSFIVSIHSEFLCSSELFSFSLNNSLYAAIQRDWPDPVKPISVL